MNLLQRLLAGRNGKLDELAGQIAERAVDEVVRRLSVAVNSMSLAEARGYVRARAARPVRQQMQFVLSAGPAVTPDISREILSRATEQTVTLVVREVVKGTRVTKIRKAA